jgi:hypothetical protein
MAMQAANSTERASAAGLVASHLTIGAPNPKTTSRFYTLAITMSRSYNRDIE